MGSRFAAVATIVLACASLTACQQDHQTGGARHVVRLTVLAAGATAVPQGPDEPSSLPGMVRVGSESGGFVGYARYSDIHMAPRLYLKNVNAQTMFPVTSADGALVGYIAPDVPFVPLATVNQPGFDIEKVRADRNGGCEDQIGDPTFRQEFPRCDDGSTGQ